MPKFDVGHIVKMLDSTEVGTIIEVKGLRYIVMLSNGFTEEVKENEIIYADTAWEYLLESKDDAKLEQYSFISRRERVDEIDLHIENLELHFQKIPPEKILKRQLAALEEALQNAQKEKLDRLIVIHGNGKGILKNAVINLLSQKNIRTYRPMFDGKNKNSAIEIIFQREP